MRGITHLPFGYLSAGQQRRMAMAKLLVAYRPVWILDEPTAALDASADRLFAELIGRHLEEGRHRSGGDASAAGLGECAGIADDGVCGCRRGVWG